MLGCPILYRYMLGCPILYRYMLGCPILYRYILGCPILYRYMLGCPILYRYMLWCLGDCLNPMLDVKMAGTDRAQNQCLRQLTRQPQNYIKIVFKKFLFSSNIENQRTKNIKYLKEPVKSFVGMFRKMKISLYDN